MTYLEPSRQELCGSEAALTVNVSTSNHLDLIGLSSSVAVDLVCSWPQLPCPLTDTQHASAERGCSVSACNGLCIRFTYAGLSEQLLKLLIPRRPHGGRLAQGSRSVEQQIL